MNYQIIMEETIQKLEQEGKIPSLLLHSCCAPCSSYVLEYLSNYFYITIFYYNPNITEKEEYQKRVKEQKNLIEKLLSKYPISFLEGDYEPEKFLKMSKGMEKLKEGETRCFQCYGLRLQETAYIAKKLNFDYFTTTLSLSPHKNSQVLNRIGKSLEEQYAISYLFSDFKKKGGYQRSIELSRKYQLYRQDYCGCIFSKQEREHQKLKKEKTEA